MKRKSILICEGIVPFENNRVSITLFTAPGPVTQNVLDSSIHFGDGGTNITMQNLNILDSNIVKCSPEDTYDFETGALIALMKMCGIEKVTKACDELYKDDNYKNALQETTECLDSLSKKYDDVVKYCDSLRESNKRLQKEKEQIIVAKDVLYNKLKKENEKLQHDYDLCKNSENALKCSVSYLNKSIAKLNNAIYGYKEDLDKVSKRCIELEAKEDILNKQEETINKREEEMSAYFGGRGKGKQYKALVELFKKIPKDKVQAAYIVAYKESLIWCTSQPTIRDSLDSLIESCKYTIPYTDKRKPQCVSIDEWEYKPTKREEMWINIFNASQNPPVDIKVAKEDIRAFLKELQDRIPKARWNGSDCLPTEYTNPYWFKHDYIYFAFYREDEKGYIRICYDEHKHYWIDKPVIEYIAPMRWDLFKKGRIAVKVTPFNYKEFYKECEIVIGRSPSYIPWDLFTVSYDKKEDAYYILNVYETKKKIVDWEDVR